MARAEEVCPAHGEPWVSVEIAPAVPEPGRVLAQLRAGLSERGIALCRASSSSKQPAIAAITLSAPEGERVSIVVDVADRVTDKRVSREIDLSTMPRDAWPLSLALAADEVLRASWAELALASAPPPKARVPPEVRRVVRDSLAEPPRPREPSAALGAAFVGDLYSGGQRQLGVDARVAFFLTPRFFVHASAGLRAADTIEAPHGKVRSNAFVFGLGPGFSLTDPSAPLGLEALARAELIGVRYRAEADATATASDRTGLAAYAKAGVAGYAAPEEGLRVTLELTLGGPLRSISVRDSGSEATAIEGLALSAALGLSGVL